MTKQRVRRQKVPNAFSSGPDELPGAELEKLVTLFQKLMAQGAKVTHNQKRRDRLGNLRQIDVLVEGTFAGWPMLGVVECKDHSRKKGVADVEAFVTKCLHLGAGLRLIVSKKGFSKGALALARHEHISCLSLLPHESHRFGFSIGEWWYGVISRWENFRLHIFLADETQRLHLVPTDQVLWQGQPVGGWFAKKFMVDFWDRTRDGDATIVVPFDNVTALSIGGKEYDVKQLACSATAVYRKKRKWVAYSGHGFFNWNSGKIVIPQACMSKLRRLRRTWRNGMTTTETFLS